MQGWFQVLLQIPYLPFVALHTHLQGDVEDQNLARSACQIWNNLCLFAPLALFNAFKNCNRSVKTHKVPDYNPSLSLLTLSVVKLLRPPSSSTLHRPRNCSGFHVLFEYKYDMGLLLIEKNELASKNEELRQVVAESQEILKREQTAHLIDITEAKKREENMKKTLNIEKKCVLDLERALLEMREELAKMKDTSKTTVTDINAQIEVLEKKRAELKAKSHAVNAKLAEDLETLES